MKKSGERRERFVHLGERLACIQRIRAGELTCAEAASEMGVDETQVYLWIELHGKDRLMTIDELRLPSTALNARLAAKVRRLAQLLLDAERRVRELHLELISKEFGAKPHRGFERVARMQPRAE